MNDSDGSADMDRRVAPTPSPGQPVRGSNSGRPIMALFDLAGRAWSLRVLWELSRAGRPLTFRELRSHCDDVSSSVLSRRLHELREVVLVATEPNGYVLTDLGRGLVASLRPASQWAREWAEALERHRREVVTGSSETG